MRHDQPNANANPNEQKTKKQMLTSVICSGKSGYCTLSPADVVPDE
jgi:hypothetical protein